MKEKSKIEEKKEKIGYIYKSLICLLIMPLILGWKDGVIYSIANATSWVIAGLMIFLGGILIAGSIYKSESKVRKVENAKNNMIINCFKLAILMLLMQLNGFNIQSLIGVIGLMIIIVLGFVYLENVEKEDVK